MDASAPSRIDRPEERQARQLGMCRRMAELGMQLAEAAAARALNPPASDDTAEPGTTIAQTPDPTALFIRLSQAVHRFITLENRIADAGLSAARPSAPPPSPPDPRRATLLRVFDEGTSSHPDREALRPRIIQLTDAALARDTAGDASIEALARVIRAGLDVELDFTRLNGLPEAARAGHSVPRPNGRSGPHLLHPARGTGPP